MDQSKSEKPGEKKLFFPLFRAKRMQRSKRVLH